MRRDKNRTATQPGVAETPINLNIRSLKTSGAPAEDQCCFDHHLCTPSECISEMRLQRDFDEIAYLVCLLLALQCTCFVRAESFTYPTAKEYQFIVGDLVNVSWDVVTSRVSLYEVCNTKIPLLCRYTYNCHHWIWLMELQ